MWANYHSHSHYCDGKYAPEIHIQKAVELGFSAFGCSSHSPMPGGRSWNMKAERYPDYLNEIHSLKSKYASDIQVYCGLEVDYVPGVVGPHSSVLQPERLDYTIGSIHYVDQFEGGRNWEIDGAHSRFLDGLDKLFQNNIQAAIERYFELTRQMLMEEKPDILGHMDKIKIQSGEGNLFSETDKWYQYAVEETLDVIKASKVIVEVNTRGLYKKVSAETYPSRWILEKLYENQIPIMINADSHLPDEMLGYYPETLKMLRGIGFKELWILWDNEWQPLPFSDSGFVIK